MENVFLRAAHTVKNCIAVCKTGWKLIGILVLMFGCLPAARSAVSVTAGTGGTLICNVKALTGSAPAFTSLGSIVISEGTVADFSAGTCTLILQPAAGWQFGTTLPTISYVTGSNITGIAGTVTATGLTVNITVSGIAAPDQITITGLQVQPLTTTATTGNVYANVASGITGIATGSSGSNFATLSVTAPVTPSLTISATPSGSFCPGTNVTFTPTSVNGGSPTYTWSLNGVDVWIGGSYTNNTLVNGNTVSCKMGSSLGCVTANPVFSNTISPTVLAAPAAVTGGNTICPGTTTALSTITTGGAWSSTNPANATINTAGIVTGIAAGTTTVSYMAAGCASTRTIFINNPPLNPVLTPTVSVICNETTLAITASGSPAPATILSQNFNSGIGPWIVDVSGSIGILSGAEWKACADSYLNEQGWYRSPDFSTFAMANADTSGSASTLSAKLTSPAFSLAEYVSATLSFQHAYDYWPAGDVFVNLEISTNGGSTWTTIVNFKGASIGSKMSFFPQSFSLNAYLGNPNVKIRFYYYATFGYYWAIDNVLITGVPGHVTPTWSPPTYLYTDAAATVPYVPGTPAGTVYMHPSGIFTPTYVTYTALASMGACTSNATSAVTVNPSPGVTSGALNLCVATSTTLTNSAPGGTWVSGNLAVTTVNATSGMITGIAPGTAVISYILGTSCAAISVVTVSSIPPAITGNSNVCLGYTSNLANASPGGIWSSSNTAIATVNSTTGLVYGLATGTANITYSLAVGCTAVKLVTVQPLPDAISGLSTICATQQATMSSTTAGGTWSSGNTVIATIGTTSGIAEGISAGSTTISYTVSATGCFTTKSLSVNPLGLIAGPANACVGFNSMYTNSAPGGTWSSSSPGIATISATTGELSGIAAGTTVISYFLPTGCTAYRTITVNALPPDITGPVAICANSSATLTNPVPGGTWSSGNTLVADVTPATGEVSGLTAGPVIITYTAPTGCFKTHLLTINPLPALIIGTSTICNGLTTNLSNATSSGTWSSSNNAVATVVPSGSGIGVVTGVAAGTVYISYTLSTGCYMVKGMLINPLPAIPVGPLNVCPGFSVTLTNPTPDGVWSSGTTAVAIAGSTTGVITGGIPGTSIISYTLPTSCLSTVVVTVNPLPAAITGSDEVCTGSTITVTNSNTGGTWSSSAPAIATVTPLIPGTGIVTGISFGPVLISYTLGTGCFATRAITVNESPAPITGTAEVCQGLTTTLATIIPFGTWSSSNIAVATVHPVSGIVAGLVFGTSTISYTVSTGCTTTTILTVHPLPMAISGLLSLCPGIPSALSNPTPGGFWSSTNSAVATIGTASGIITGLTTGFTTVSYTLPTGCAAAAVAVVNPLPAPITGAANVCVAATTAYINTTPGGTWSSSNNTIASAGAVTGVISGIAAGTATISYTLSTGCYSTKTITVNPLPDPISGANNICQNASTLLSNATPGGTWSVSNIAIATTGSSTGIVQGISGGATNISYTLPTGCYTLHTMSVTALPANISGPGNVCESSTISLTDATPGGSWSSGAPAVATINAAGILTGLSAGTTSITYMLPLGCIAARTITVHPLPAAIVGPTVVCTSIPATMTNASPSGFWTSSTPGVAAINSSTGVMTGIVPGTATITYTLPTGCFKTANVTVNQNPSAITGLTPVCTGTSATYTNTISGGTWSSADAGVASVHASTGLMTGVAAGNTTITYQLSTGCLTTKAVSVHPLPAAITGPAALCQGLSSTFICAPAGGSWTSGNTAVALLGSSSGFVVGAAAGTAGITYTLSTGCKSATLLTVHALPAAITGSGNICLGLTSVLASATGGGSWSSSNATIATVGTSGGVTGIALGTAIITYTIGGTCYVTRPITVNPLPSPITGNVPTCPGPTFTLGNPVTGGSWSSSVPLVATVGSSTGIVAPISNGTTTITYTLITGCYATTVVSVIPAAPIIGNTSICVGAISTLSHATPGGTWSSSSPLTIGIGAASGITVGYAATIATISYTLPGGCVATRGATVSITPAAISGTGSICPGFSATLTNTTPGGTWSSSNSSIGSTGSSSGVVTGVSPGTFTVSYTVAGGCSVIKAMTTNAVPAPITGATSICVGSSSPFSIAATGGIWSSGNTAIASVNSSGLVTGISSGTTQISYTPVSGCTVLQSVTINDIPAPIVGLATYCTGVAGALTNSSPGGSWSSTDPSVATIGSLAGNVSPLSAGTTIISYTTGIGCGVSRTITVNQTPAPLAGLTSVCTGHTSTLSSAPAGGNWTSSNNVTATISTSGIVAGIAAGTTIISYTFPTGCSARTIVTVSNTPSTIMGTMSMCAGASTTLSDPSAGGGIWTSGTPAVALAGTSSGVITGITAGTADITYTIGAACSITAVVTVYPLPAPISGPSTACTGTNAALTNSSPGGTWSSSAGTIATIGTASGTVAGISAGTVQITYTLPSGCIATKFFTVNPSPGPIAGVLSVCENASTPLTNTVAGGNWSAAAIGVATVNAFTGVVTGIAGGTAAITYTLAAGCSTYTVVTVNNLPLPITGPSMVCAGLTIPLSSASAGGTWISGSAAIAAINSTTGTLSGLMPGSSRITYTLPTGCSTNRTTTVNPLSPNTGIGSTCTGFTTTLANIGTSGTWTSGDLSVATVNASGTVSGITPGTVAVSYTLSTGCIATTLVTVISTPPVTGSLALCTGGTTLLANSATGGTWTSSATSVATISSGGVVSGISTGTAAISYHFGNGCISAATATINPLPSVITGPANMCAGSQITLTSATASGSWSSSNTAIATVGPITGFVTGIASGTATITYQLPTGCFRTSAVTVNPNPPSITGPLQLCAGGTGILTNSTAGGTWASGDAAVTSIVSTTGFVSGLAPGTTTVTYTLPTGCSTTVISTVNPLPLPVTGTASVCVGSTTLLSNPTTGGTWSAFSGSLSVGSASGIVTGVAAGTGTVTYTLPTGCKTTIVVTAHALPAAISGTAQLCAGQSAGLSTSPAGGTWMSSAVSVATIGTSGLWSAMIAGNTTITYTLPTGCFATRLVSVNALPGTITGSPGVCQGGTTMLSSLPSGGTWASGLSAIATVSGAGLVTGVAPGLVAVTYTLPSGCAIATLITVNPLPATITGTGGVCIGQSGSLTSVPAGGTWASSLPTIATVDAATGLAGGISAGSAVITYTLPTGCTTTTTINIYPPPAAITGTAAICEGTTTALTSATPGGTWLSANSAIASVVAGTGVTYGVTPGTTTISYILPTGCAISRTVTVNPLPPTITGATSACLSTSMALINTTPGGTWTSSNTAIAPVDGTTGIVTGAALGTANITYTLPTGCKTSTTITINTIPASISGPLSVCNGSPAYFTNSTPGGIWSSSNMSVATITPVSGISSSLSAGTTVVSYTLTTGCYRVHTLNVLALQPIAGSSNICAGDTTTFTNGVTGGAWSSSTVSVATVSTSGRVHAVAPGVAVISYTLSSGCIATKAITVNQLPVAYLVTGGGSFCVGGAGMPVALNGSAIGYGYQLYTGSTPASYLTGTGSTLNFGLQTTGGFYTVRAINLTTGCSRNMLGSVAVTPVTVGPAAVTILTGTGDTVCSGTTLNFVPAPYLGGSTPAYQWRVNGVLVSSGTTYSYTPATGDLVTCKLTSNASCASPNIATASRIFTVLPNVIPAAGITATPDDTICAGNNITFIAYATHGGTHPVFTWTKNGVFADTGSTFITTPANGDLIQCILESNATCRTTDTAWSNTIKATVLPNLVPAVTVNATPGFSTIPGGEILFSVVVSNTGASPGYQWYINSSPLPGATNSSLVWNSFNNGDSVSCAVTSVGQCGGLTTRTGGLISVQNVGINGTANVPSGLQLVPNPNNGHFTIAGLVYSTDGAANIFVTNVLGQIVHQQAIVIRSGRVKSEVTVSETLANGYYLLSLQTGNHLFNLPFIIRR